MKILEVFFVLMLSFDGFYCSVISTKSSALMSSAFINIVKHFSNTNREVRLISDKIDINMIDSLVFNNLKTGNIPVTLINLNKIIMPSQFEVDNSAILMFDSVASLIKFNEKFVLTNQYPKPLQFFIFIQNATFLELSSFRYSKVMSLLYFIIKENKLIRLLTFEFYSDEYCRKPHLVEINNFNGKARKWKNSVFSVKKFHNFHDCYLFAAFVWQNPGFGYAILPNRSFFYWGYNYKIIETLSSNLNFTLIVNPSDEKENFLFKMPTDLLVKMVDLVELPKSKFKLFMTQPHIFTANLMAVPPGEEFDGYEKLLLPFDFMTWTLIALTFLSAYATIFVLYLMKRSIRNVVFGENVITPSLNVTMIFFGISQIVLPRKTFTRFLTMMFILFCLIIRTAWQSMMFEFMNKVS